MSGWLAGGTCVLVQCWRPHKLVLPGTHSMLAPDVVVPCGGTQAGGFVAAGGALIPGGGITGRGSRASSCVGSLRRPRTGSWWV